MGSIEGIEQLLEWARSQGAVILRLVDFQEISPGNIGAIYQENDDDGELDGSQIKLPIKLAITLRDAIELFGKDFEVISNNTRNTNSVLKLYLCREVSEEYLETSKYKSYLKLLPTSEQVGTPYTWTSSYKELLKGTNLGNSLLENLQQLVEEWWEIINMLPESIKKPQDHFINMKFYYEYKFYKDDDLYEYLVKNYCQQNWTNFANYLWSSIIIKSRSFPAYLLKQKNQQLQIKQDEAMLLPLIDLLNHDPKSKVNWIIDDEYFSFKCDNPQKNSQLFNNYGMKGNEELLLAYGFCIENNVADSAALKIKIPPELIKEIIDFGIELPTLDTYTTSVIRTEESQNKVANYEDGIVFFITETNLPENLIQVFQYLVKNEWEDDITLRMQLHGLNQLRGAIESKLQLLKVPNVHDSITNNISIYIKSQQKIFQSTIKSIKSMEKHLLKENKSQLISLKSVYKKDVKLTQSLLLTFGFTSYEQVLEHEFQDQYWLLYLIRCYNREEYMKDVEQDEDDENYLPKWIKRYFDKLIETTSEIKPQETLQYKDIYQNLIPPLNKAVPEIFDRGKWGIKEFIYSGRLLDKIGFVRGKEQECILVIPK